MGLDAEKYQESILFFLNHCNDEQLNRVKLAGLLYFLDFDHFEQHDRSVTGDTYARTTAGPVPEHLDDLLDLLAREGHLLRQTAVVFDYAQERFIALAEPHPECLSDTELETLQAICRDWAAATAEEVAAAARREEPWQAVADGEEIPLAYAYYRDKFADQSTDLIVEQEHSAEQYPSSLASGAESVVP